MRWTKRLVMVYRNLYFILGAPGLMIGAFSILSFVFGIYIISREYNRPRKTEEDVIRRVLTTWIRLPDYLGLTLFDYAHRWSAAPSDRRAEAAGKLNLALHQLGNELDRQSERFPLVQLLRMEIQAPGAGKLAGWRSSAINGVVDDEMRDVILLVERNPDGPPVMLEVVYQVAPPFQGAAEGLEYSYRQLLLGVVGLSGFSLLCMGYMIVQAKSLSDRAAREAAQDATLDLADRTCHELGNGIFILANEQKNLNDHLDLIERFIDEEPIAREAASKRVGLVDGLEKRWEHALKRERRARGIDPDSELRGSVALTRRVAEQIQICAHYIGMTVRELDSFLKNAIEAVEAQVEKSVGICVHFDADGVTVVITDRGPGIPEQALRNIFDHGFSTKGRGRGRGLSIVSDSILLIGSSLEVRNREIGGAEFRFTLPRGGSAAG